MQFIVYWGPQRPGSGGAQPPSAGTECIIQKSRTFLHFLTFLRNAYLATKIPDMSGKILKYGNPTLL